MEVKMEKMIYDYFSHYIFLNTGIVYVENDYYRLDKRLLDLASHLNLKNLEDLYKLYQGNITEENHRKLIEIATNNETYFFRDEIHFTTLKKVIIPELVKKKNSKPIHLWSAGCSTGQEPYTMLMTLLEEFPLLDFTIDATDLSTEVLEKADKAIYDEMDVKRGDNNFLLEKYFEPLQKKNWKIKDKYKGIINFEQVNLLLDSFPNSYYDIIFCRNVLIYQNIQNKSKIIEKFHHALNPNGYFIMGSGELLPELNFPFERFSIEGSVIYKKQE